MDFYRAFEERFRGTRESVKEKLKIYLPLVTKIDKSKKIVDLGCGRGEWLDLLSKNGYKDLIGVDRDENMVEKSDNYEIIIDSALGFLQKAQENSIGLISSFHMIEHIEFNELIELIREAFRVLDNNGILLVESPNPENLKVSSESFYLDPTHKRALPMELVKFAFEYFGFEARVLRVNHKEIKNSIKALLEGVSPDYAVVGFKDKSMIDESFFEGGVSLDLMESIFDERIDKIEIELNDLKNENIHFKNLYKDVVNSKSWKITKPLRDIANISRQIKRWAILKITTLEVKNNKLSKRAKEIYDDLKEELKK